MLMVCQTENMQNYGIRTRRRAMSSNCDMPMFVMFRAQIHGGGGVKS